MVAKRATIEELRDQRAKDLEVARSRGVTPSGGVLPKADAVYEVVEGFHHVPAVEGNGVVRLGPGDRFRPTEAQHAGRTLRGKARELSATEYAGISRSADPQRAIRSTGADIGLRALPMTKAALRTALDAGLTEDDVLATDPTGSDDTYIKADVEAIIEAKASPDVE